MKKFNLIFISLLLISCNSLPGKTDEYNYQQKEQNQKTEKTVSAKEKVRKGIIKNNSYQNTAIDWNISIPETFSIYYPTDYVKKKSEIPGLIKNKYKKNELVSFGLNEKNYFSAYLNPITDEIVQGENMKELLQSNLNNHQNIAGSIVKELQNTHAIDEEVAFKQKWEDIEIDGQKYSVYDIKMVSYPEDIPIINQLVYVRKIDNDNIFFIITHNNQKEKNAMLENFLTSIERSGQK